MTGALRHPPTSALDRDEEMPFNIRALFMDADPASWNRLRQDQPKEMLITLEDLDCRGADLTNRDIYNVSLKGTDLTDAQFSDTLSVRSLAHLGGADGVIVLCEATDPKLSHSVVIFNADGGIKIFEAPHENYDDHLHRADATLTAIADTDRSTRAAIQSAIEAKGWTWHEHIIAERPDNVLIFDPGDIRLQHRRVG